MRLLFISSGLEPGRNGVGDYCRRLGLALRSRGHEVMLLSLNDRREEYAEENGVSAAHGLNEARLAATLPWRVRCEEARRMVDSFNPDWISLHFVCYGFHPRGLVGSLIAGLSEVCQGRRLHLMMHELWVMWRMKCRLSDRLLGILQRRGVLQTLHLIRPHLVDTTIPFYRAVLKMEGVDCGLLPLCGNFTPTREDARTWLAPRLTQAGMPSLWPRDEPLLVAGFFGTIFGHWDPMPLLLKLSVAAKSAGQEVLLLSGGKCGVAGERLFDALPTLVDGVRFRKLRLGALAEGQASEYLNTLDLGLTCYSKLFVGKSSTAATMLDHGLSVCAGGRDRKLETFWGMDQQVEGVFDLDDAWPSNLERLYSREVQDSSQNVGGELLARLLTIS